MYIAMLIIKSNNKNQKKIKIKNRRRETVNKLLHSPTIIFFLALHILRVSFFNCDTAGTAPCFKLIGII